MRETCRLNEPLLSIYSNDRGRRTAIKVPAGAVIVVTACPLHDARMEDVLWDGKTVRVFTIDLRARGALIRMPIR